jgi:hypothetical protein
MNLRLKGAIYGKFGSQVNFARKFKIDETYLSKIVTNRRKLPDKEQKLWARWLDCMVDDIF